MRADTTAIVSGSFDPITLGHMYVIEQAMKMADRVVVLVARNSGKNHRFTNEERMFITRSALIEEYGCAGFKTEEIVVEFLPEGVFLAQHAKEEYNANLIVRGLRNVVDFEYEHGIQLINEDIQPDITTVFVMPPAHLVAISSSMIRGIAGLHDWENVAKKYLPQAAIEAFK